MSDLERKEKVLEEPISSQNRQSMGATEEEKIMLGG